MPYWIVKREYFLYYTSLAEKKFSNGVIIFRSWHIYVRTQIMAICFHTGRHIHFPQIFFYYSDTFIFLLSFLSIGVCANLCKVCTVMPAPPPPVDLYLAKRRHTQQKTINNDWTFLNCAVEQLTLQ